MNIQKKILPQSLSLEICSIEEKKCAKESVLPLAHYIFRGYRATF